MPRAKIKGVECDVRVTRDLTDNWAIEVAPVRATPRKWEPYKASPALVIIKVRADTREAAAKVGLERLKASNQIDDYSI